MADARSGITVVAGYLLIASIPFFMAQAAVATVFGSFEEAIGSPPQVLLIWLAALLLACSPVGFSWIVGGQGRLPIVFGVLTIFTVAISFRSALDFEAFRELMQVATGLAVYFVTFLGVRDLKIRRAVVFILLLMTSASAFLCLAEFVFGFHVAWSGYSVFAKGVPVGLEYSPVPLAYALVVPTTVAVVAIFAQSNQKFIVPAWLTWLTATSGFAALIATASRSGLGGVAIGSAVGILYLGRGRNNVRTIAAALFGVIGLLGIILSSGLIEYVWKGGVSGDSRLGATWITYVPILMVNPLGLAEGTDMFRALADAERLLGIDIPTRIATHGLAQAPHHFLLTAGISYGWIAVLSLVAIYTHALLLARRAIRFARPDDPARIVVVAFLAGMFALLVHSCFHNASLLHGEMRGWITLAILNSTSISILSQVRPVRTDAARSDGLQEWQKGLSEVDPDIRTIG